MSFLLNWLSSDKVGAGILAAGVGALGFVAKTIIESFRQYLSRRRKRRAKLIELRPLLRASAASFDVQTRLREELIISLGESGLSKYGYEASLEDNFDRMNDEQRRLHKRIRDLTVFNLNPLNLSLLEWLRKDKFFKGHKTGRYMNLPALLAELEVHLLLWRAKYDAWIPDQPRHALVYVADELDKSVGFPPGIDEAVEAAIAAGQ